MPNSQPATEKLPLLLLAGPTAVGKSELALRIAEKLGGEIVSVDSMQVYRGLDIGTAKPTTEQRARVRHHLIDVVELTEPFDAAQFARLARQTVQEIQGRGNIAILSGGTGLYFKAFLAGLGEAPAADNKLRAELESAPLADLLAELAQKDPATYQTIDRQNARRVIRAIEVLRVTGKPYSHQRASWDELARDNRSEVFIGLARSAADLRERINRRVEEMFRGGLVAETEKLLNQGLDENRTAMQALGYRQVVEHLREIRSLAQTIELVKIRTRQFAKRQMTWFRKYGPSHWIDLSSQDTSENAADIIIARWRGAEI